MVCEFVKCFSKQLLLLCAQLWLLLIVSNTICGTSLCFCPQSSKLCFFQKMFFFLWKQQNTEYLFIYLVVLSKPRQYQPWSGSRIVVETSKSECCLFSFVYYGNFFLIKSWNTDKVH